MIKRAFIEESGGGRLRHESALVAAELAERGVEFQTFTIKKIRRRQLPLDRQTLVVGDMDCTFGALKQLGIPIPPNNDYPKALEHLLHRRIWTSSFGQVEQSFTCGAHSAVFVKPSGRKKCFTGLVAQSEPDFYRIQVSRNETVFCSEVVSWRSEYRVYVANSKILAIDFYQGDRDVELDEDIVAQAVAALDASGESHAGYAIDFGVLSSGRTALVEMNDGFSVGAYDIDQKNYTDMVVARWEELMASEPLEDRPDDQREADNEHKTG
ncbi:MAG: ATP-grasp domain-containing protein [Phycisphaerae bacterium]|nr:ATP-grasp domain-containing protein [Phycisphaerae bacterium]